MNARFVVQISLYHEPVKARSFHRSPKAAARSLASAIKNVRGLDTARVYCTEDDKTFPLLTFRELIASGYYA